MFAVILRRSLVGSVMTYWKWSNGIKNISSATTCRFIPNISRFIPNTLRVNKIAMKTSQKS